MRTRRAVAGAFAAAALTLPLLVASPATASPAPAGIPEPPKQPVDFGSGGAVSTVDPYATKAGIEVLKAGGNAADAAVAVAAVIGVTEPFSAGIGGGGFLVYYDARTGRVSTVDGREEAPARFRRNSFIDPKTGQPIPFDEAVTSGLSAGVPGTVRLWERALDRFGTKSWREVLAPAIQVAERGFVVDRTFNVQVRSNRARFADFTSTRSLFLPGGNAPAVGSVFRNPDLAATYRLLARGGADAFYTGGVARDIARTAQNPPVRPGADRRVRPGLMTTADLRQYTAPMRRPTHVDYRGLDVYGMPPPSSGGSTIGEALNILERFNLRDVGRAQALHYYLEASRLAYADRARYIGDPAYVDVPLQELLSDGFARERACLVRPKDALESPVPPGSPDGNYSRCDSRRGAAVAAGEESPNTTHLTVADRFGNVASLTFTIEQIGGNGMVVPGRGFLLNNELTDFSFGPPVPGTPNPNLPAAGKRPRSSMSPTIVLKDGRPFFALGSPGGSTIITTVLQVLVNHIDLGLSVRDAIAAPRASQRNSDPGIAEPAFLDSWYGRRLLRDYDQELVAVAPPPGFPPGLFAPEIGAVEAVRFYPSGNMLAAAEPTRRGGGSAKTVMGPR